MTAGTGSTPLLIVGLGNLLCSDDGVGVRAAVAITRHHRLPAGVRVLDGGTLGLQLLGELAEAETVLLVDAVRVDSPPGTVVVLDGEEVANAVRDRLSVHQVGVADLLGALGLIGRAPRLLRLVGVVPKSLELGVDCSPEVEAALPALVRRVVEEARAVGFDLPRYNRRDPAAAFPSGETSDEPQGSASSLEPRARLALGL
ncbi:MAG TPA: hydrogenase maturation protease [Thermoanaerobaculia bacterium]|nr:hydrogenase maturation protease [Thermoanaerobaculia bacterium]